MNSGAFLIAVSPWVGRVRLNCGSRKLLQEMALRVHFYLSIRFDSFVFFPSHRTMGLWSMFYSWHHLFPSFFIFFYVFNSYIIFFTSETSKLYIPSLGGENYVSLSYPNIACYSPFFLPVSLSVIMAKICLSFPPFDSWESDTVSSPWQKFVERVNEWHVSPAVVSESLLHKCVFTFRHSLYTSGD